MLLKSCGRCKALIPYGKGYCSRCQPIVDREREERAKQHRQKSNRQYNQKRDPKYIRFYNSSDWKILSAKYAADKGYRCEGCGVIASEVHHVDAIQTETGWEKRLDYENLKLFCIHCHNAAHNRFQKKKSKKDLKK